MFDYDYTLESLSKIDGMKNKKRVKFLKNLFLDEEFVKWLFQPNQQATSSQNLMTQVNDLYAVLTKPKVIKAINEMIEEVGYEEFNRSHATFIYTLANIAIESNAANVNEAARRKKEGSLNNKEVKDFNENIEKYNKYISELVRSAKQIVKKDAKNLSKDTNIPKFICYTAFYSVPQSKYIDKFKIGYYLNNLLNSVYADVSTYNEFDRKIIKWRPFFKEIFGKDNVVEAATFILLEGVHRIDKYKNSDAVKDCWDSLTEFALQELNDAPDSLRSQMLELYIKRIDKMFANKSFDLRVDLLSINDTIFPKLNTTINRYSDKISDILKRGKNND